ncbi:MAG TPA: BON domain-containing protein [Thermoanaerobaculia bacterium]|nr:BON domain-containing protein [Thermoanaerobaculia bacterium]
MSRSAAPHAALQRQLKNALRWHPGIDAARVSIAVDDAGRVMLNGSVATYAEKCALEEAMRGIPGVASVNNCVDVRLTIGDYRTDAALERILRDLFEFLSRMPPERPRATVVNGWVTIEGSVLWPHQKQLIEKAVREIAGVKGITNCLVVERTARRQARATK